MRLDLLIPPHWLIEVHLHVVSEVSTMKTRWVVIALACLLVIWALALILIYWSHRSLAIQSIIDSLFKFTHVVLLNLPEFGYLLC